MDFDFIEGLLWSLKDGNVFKWNFLMSGCKALALSLLLFRIIENYIKEFDSEGAKFGSLFHVFGYAFFILSADWIVDFIESAFVLIDSSMYDTPSNLYTDLEKAIIEHDKQLYEDVGFLDMVSMPIDLIIASFYGVILIVLITLCKIADLAMTAGYLLSRMFLIELMKLLFPLVIALSTLNITKDLLGKWIKRYIGLFLLGLGYIGIINFCALLQTTLLAQFEADSDGQLMGMGHYIYGACITVVVVFTFKVKMFSTVTSYITGFFS